jgi:hypothetical protein
MHHPLNLLQLSHCDENAVFLSPVAALSVGKGRVVGREALRNY